MGLGRETSTDPRRTRPSPARTPAPAPVSLRRRDEEKEVSARHGPALEGPLVLGFLGFRASDFRAARRRSAPYEPLEIERSLIRRSPQHHHRRRGPRGIEQRAVTRLSFELNRLTMSRLMFVRVRPKRRSLPMRMSTWLMRSPYSVFGSMRHRDRLPTPPTAGPRVARSWVVRLIDEVCVERGTRPALERPTCSDVDLRHQVAGDGPCSW